MDAPIRELKNIIEEYPDLKELVAEELGIVTAVKKYEKDLLDSFDGAEAARATLILFTEGTNRNRIESFLKSKDNEPQTVEAIEKATGIPQPSIRHTFSTRFPDAFEAVEVPDSRLKHWRMVINHLVNKGG
jgi:hypothetical protein